MHIKLSKRVFFEIIMSFFLLVLSFLSLLLFRQSSDEKVLWLTGTFCLISFIWLFNIVLRRNKNVYFIVFLCCFFLFTNGQTLLYIFNLGYDSLFLYNNSTISSLNCLHVFCLLSYTFSALLISIFTLFFNKFSSKKIFNEIKIDNKKLRKALLVFAIISLIISAPCYFYILISKFIITMQHGYIYLYDGEIVNDLFLNIIGTCEKFFFLSLIILYILYCYRKKKFSAFVAFIIIVTTSIEFISGMRGLAISKLLVLILIYLLTGKKLNFKKFFVTSIAIFIIICMIPIIKNIRNLPNKSIGSIISSTFSYNRLDKNPIIETVAELGGSAKTFVMVYDIVPSKYNFQYGMTYVKSFGSLIPSFIRPEFLKEIPGGLDEWLKNVYNMNYGPGFSLIAENYYNFGWYGFIMTGVIFLLFLIIFSLDNLYSPFFTNIFRLLSLNYLSVSFFLGRKSTLLIFRDILYQFIVPLILIIIIYKIINRGGKKNDLSFMKLKGYKVKIEKEEHNNMKKIEIDEIKKIEVKLLKFIDKICEENNIKYYLCGGSAIGAIRHNGFIPWDDDIDIFLIRKDYFRLIEILQKNESKDYKLMSIYNCKDYYIPFSKFIDNNTIYYEENVFPIDNLGVFVDIFPIDAVPDNKLLRYIYLKKIWIYKSIFSNLYILNITSSSRIRVIIKKLVRLIFKSVNLNSFASFIDKESSKYDIQKKELAGVIVAGYGKREIMNKKIFMQGKKIDFEGEKFYILQKYDQYLKALYGNYMQLPPVEKRSSHHVFDAYWKE